MYSDSISYARGRDVVVVGAAGNAANNNDGGTSVWPCNFTQDNLICVAALDQSYALASFSNTGTTSVDVGAPGTNILSAWPGSVQTESPFVGWVQSGAGWGIETACNFGLGPLAMLTNPAGWCDFNGTKYDNNTDSTFYKAFDLSGLLGAGLSFLFIADTELGFDFASVYASSAGGNPDSSTALLSGSGSTGGFFRVDLSLEDCLTSTCSIGYGLQTDFNITDLGVAVANMKIQKTETNSSVYTNIDGTSMASPHVAGIAALVRAFNPNFTYTQTVEAIKNGGEFVAALSGKTTTGRAANAMGAIAYITEPTGVAAVVQ